jgi:uncharacterized protein (DUF1684 family)
LLLLALVAACRDGRDGHAVPAIADEARWKAELVADRARKDTEMKTSATSPFAAIERHILTATGPTYLALHGDSLQLSAARDGEAVIGFRPDAERWIWEAARGDVTATQRDDARPVAPGPLAAPTVFQIGDGRFHLLTQGVEGTFVVTVYDTHAAPLQHARGLAYFPPDAHHAVRARLVRWDPPVQIKLPTMIGLEKTFVRYAKLAFELDGTRCELTAFQPVGATGLFVPFRDASSGKATYGAGRYLDLDLPATGDTLVLDFNRAYNPLCAYSPAFNCPVPPIENQLAIAIEAGERTYDH